MKFFIFHPLFVRLFYFMMFPQSSAQVKNGGALPPLVRGVVRN
jgi:hypothetical protein